MAAAANSSESSHSPQLAEAAPLELETAEITITLRKIELSDAEDLMLWATDDRVTRFCSWDTYTSIDDALDYIGNIALNHPWSKVICIEDKAIGAITVTPYSRIDWACRAELGYVLGYKYWGKGIVTKAVKMTVDSLFNEWSHLRRVEALVDVDNKGSQRVLEKVGFQREGVLREYIMFKGSARDFVMFSFLSSDKRKCME